MIDQYKAEIEIKQQHENELKILKEKESKWKLENKLKAMEEEQAEP